MPDSDNENGDHAKRKGIFWGHLQSPRLPPAPFACVPLFGKFDRTEEIALENHSASLDYLLNMCRDGAEYRTTATVSVAELTAMHGAGHELPVSGDAYARWIGAGSGNPWRLGPRQ